jgi:fatty acid desaturase
VRLARLRALERSAPAIGGDGEPSATTPRRRRERPPVSAIVATALVLGGAVLFTAGAVLAAWPVWAAGLTLFAGGFVLYRP